jgi:DNA-binding beta-propeller fold protein YncE
VAGRTPGQPGDVVYVTSRSENRVQTFTIAESGDHARLVPSSYFFLDRVGTNNGASSDTRGLVFGQGGDVGYFMNREPPSLAVVDTSIGADGVPRNLVTGGTDLCREASGLAVADLGDGERVFVSCFTEGELYVIDPRAGVEVEAIATVGRGPFGVAVSAARKKLYVTNFFENSIAVIDLTPGAPTQYRVVLRIQPQEDS